MNIIKAVPAAAVALLAASIPATGQAKDGELAGCYKPVSGFATSACTDESCTTQTGVYKIVLKNAQAIYGQRVLVMSGTFDGLITAMPNHCGAADAQHVLTDRDRKSKISTGVDVACFTGGGDFVNNVEIVETLKVSGGTGAYAQLTPGGTVTLTGKLGIKTGINKFKVTPMPGDEICFDGRD